MLNFKRKTLLRKKYISQAYGKVLEIGFGNLINIKFLSNKVSLYVGLDPSFAHNMLVPQDFGYCFPVQLCNSPSILNSFPDDSFDSIVTTWTLCTLNDPQDTLKQIFRLLKPTGKYIFIEHGLAPIENSIVRKMQSIWNPMQQRLAEGCSINTEIEELIRKAGFQVELDKGYIGLIKPLSFTYYGVAYKA